MILFTDQKILSQVDNLRKQNISLEYRNNQLQEVIVSIICVPLVLQWILTNPNSCVLKLTNICSD